MTTILCLLLALAVYDLYRHGALKADLAEAHQKLDEIKASLHL